MKRLVKISATVIAVGMAAVLAGCDGCAGCAGCAGNTKNYTVTNSNWYTDTSFNGIQPSFIEGDDNFSKEEIIYGVTFNGSNASNSTYSVEYGEGQYTTEFYAKKYNWNDDKIPEAYRAQAEETVYYYRTEFSISVKYKLSSGEESKLFNDSIITECYFRSAADNLQPVYSKQVLKTTSPAKPKANKLEDAYTEVDVTYENFYNKNFTEITSFKQQADNERTATVYSLKKIKNSLFDNSSLYVAVRSLKLSDGSSQTISVFSPADGGVVNCSVAGAESYVISETERESISKALQAQNLYTPSEAVDENGNPVQDKGVPAVVAGINHSGDKITAATQTVWYAKVTNTDNNTSRATMIRMNVPLSFGLGSLTFSLQEVRSTLWNK